MQLLLPDCRDRAEKGTAASQPQGSVFGNQKDAEAPSPQKHGCGSCLLTELDAVERAKAATKTGLTSALS